MAKTKSTKAGERTHETTCLAGIDASAHECTCGNTAVTRPLAHTPGPWRVVTGVHGIPSIHARNGAVLSYQRHDKNRTETAANARLIAAAPELLQACKAIALAEGDVDSQRVIAMSKVRAAIAKAD